MSRLVRTCDFGRVRSALSRRRRIPHGLLIGFVLAAAPLFAQESGGTPEKPSVLIWQVLNFLILAGLLGWLAVKQGGPLLAARSAGIKEGLAAGEKAKAEAEARAAQVQAKLANLEKEIAAMRASAKEERERETDRIRRETQTEIARINQQAEHEIESAGKHARMELQRTAAIMAIELAEQKVRTRMSPEIQAALLQGFLSDLPRNGGVDALSHVE
jgi:F-type H+-transporting ATPase subunit b